jgi:hypothetical protein
VDEIKGYRQSRAAAGTRATQSPGVFALSFRNRGVSARAVGSFVPKLTRKAMEKYGFSAAALITDWPTIVGRDIAAYTVPQRLKWPRAVEAYSETEADSQGRPGATLILRVDAARALDVQYKGRQIVERINAYFGYRAVAELRIVQAPIEPLAQAKNPVLPRSIVTAKAQPSRPPVDLAGVGDERLRAALERLQKGLSGR